MGGRQQTSLFMTPGSKKQQEAKGKTKARKKKR